MPTATPPAATPPATAPSVASADVPVVAFLSLTSTPELIDTTPAKAGFGLVGALVAISAGSQIVKDNEIENPAGQVAADVAKAYAAAHSYRVADTPLAVEKIAAQEDLKAATAQGARYLVTAGSPGMNLLYFSFDWTHFDLMYSQVVVITDVTENKIVARSRCFIRTKKRDGLMGHDQLLADKAAALKQLIRDKAGECAGVMKAELKI
jgi:hypothetical protein